MIRTFYPTKDSTITNAYDEWFAAQHKDANLGASDILETYALYDRDGNESMELSRIVLGFDFAGIFAELGTIDFTKTRFVLKLTNAPHGETLPVNFELNLHQLKEDWDEGVGLDFETLSDTGGVCWTSASDSVDWVVPGGDFAETFKTFEFSDGDENLEIDITDWAEDWHDLPEDSLGMVLKFPPWNEVGNVSFYTKRFFARTSSYFYKRPVLEVQIDDAVSEYSNEGRERFRLDSPLYSATSNYLYYFNRPRRGLEDIPNNGDGDVLTITVNLEDEDGNAVVTGLIPERVSTGVYRVAARLPSSYPDVTGFDKWYITGVTGTFYCGTFSICAEEETKFTAQKSILSIKNHKPVYKYNEVLRMEVDAIPYGWNPNVYVSYFSDGRKEKLNLSGTYYRVTRDIDTFIVCEASVEQDEEHTKVSYDDNGNFFNFNFSILEPGYMYTFSFVTKIGEQTYSHLEQFKFRVEKDKVRHS